MGLSGRVAIVTGGGRGIGRAIARRFAGEGAQVVIAQRDPESAQRTCQEVRDAGGTTAFVQTDVSQPEAVAHLVDETVRQFGGLDILVNNAALLGENRHLLDVPLETWDRVIATNLTGPFLCSQAAARVMAQRGGGSILNVSSTNGQVPQPRCAAYAAAKGGLEVLTRSMAVDLAPYNIRVNTIAPGPIQSRSPDEEPPQNSSMTLLGRVGLPCEVASLALFLASDEADFITGQQVTIDGGTLINAYRIYGQSRSHFRQGP